MKVKTVVRKGTRQLISAAALPVELVAVALIDAPTCAAVGDMSVSWWYEEVRAGRAPAPAIRKPRCSRWRVADVHAYWKEVAEKASANAQASAIVIAQAKKASSAAQARRQVTSGHAGVAP